MRLPETFALYCNFFARDAHAAKKNGKGELVHSHFRILSTVRRYPSRCTPTTISHFRMDELAPTMRVRNLGQSVAAGWLSSRVLIVHGITQIREKCRPQRFREMKMKVRNSTSPLFIAVSNILAVESCSSYH